MRGRVNEFRQALDAERIPSDAAARAGAEPRGAAKRRSRSDLGTILLHWAVVISVLFSLATGLRLAIDDNTLWFPRQLDAILPQGEIWTPHFIAGLVFLAGIVSYALYLRFGRLQRRVSLRKTVVFTLPTSGRMKWGAANVVLYWILYAAALALAATGVLMYLGWGDWVVTVHYIGALVVLAYIAAHVISHYAYGGIDQWLRLFRPQSLRIRRGTMRRPFALALVAEIAVAAVAVLADTGLRSTLTVAATTTPPKIDGVLDDPVWQSARPVEIHTMQGVNLGGSGESTVLAQAAYDDENVYFAFRWQDPTRSIKRLPLVKRKDGWHLIHEHEDVADENTYYEDKFAVAFSRSDAFGNGGSTHMGPKPLADEPGALNKRGLHYTTDGTYMDMWQWKASRGGMLGVVDDMWFGPPVPANEGQRAGQTRYSAGYDGDPGRKFYEYNWKNEPPGGYRGPVQVVRLPRDWQAMTAKLGTVAFGPDFNDDADSQWWMFEDESAPYSEELDATIPVGTVIPGVLISGDYEGSRADVTGAARWEDGWWTLEATRALTTTDDVKDLPMDPDSTCGFRSSIAPRPDIRGTSAPSN